MGLSTVFLQWPYTSLLKDCAKVYSADSRGHMHNLELARNAVSQFPPINCDLHFIYFFFFFVFIEIFFKFLIFYIVVDFVIH